VIDTIKALATDQPRMFICQLNRNVAAANLALQEIYNKDGASLRFSPTICNSYTPKDYKYRIGDKVVFLKNTTSYSNGQTGTLIEEMETWEKRQSKQDPLKDADAATPAVVTATDQKQFKQIIKWKISCGKKMAYIPVSSVSTSLAPAFAINVFKAQGSEYDNVVCVLDNPYTKLQCTQALYTAITRAQKSVVVVAPNVYVLNCAIKQKMQRSTNLMMWLQNPQL
jgi:ATP-dependent exoDNAse (exonuclease V) alpha subunit